MGEKCRTRPEHEQVCCRVVKVLFVRGGPLLLERSSDNKYRKKEDNQKRKAQVRDVARWPTFFPSTQHQLGVNNNDVRVAKGNVIKKEKYEDKVI